VTQLGVDLGVQLGITDEVDDPSLGLVRPHVELLSQHGDGNTLMDPTKSLEDHQPRVFNELVQTGDQEEVVDQDGLAFPQLLLGAVEVKVDIEVLDEGSDGVLVCVGLLLDHLDQVLHDVAPGALVDDDSGRQVAEDPGASGLDGVQVLLLVKEEVDDEIPALGMVEKDKE